MPFIFILQMSSFYALLGTKTFSFFIIIYLMHSSQLLWQYLEYLRKYKHFIKSSNMFKSLLHWWKIEIIVRYCLLASKFRRILFMIWKLPCKRAIYCFLFFIVFQLFSIVLKQWNNRVLKALDRMFLEF